MKDIEKNPERFKDYNSGRGSKAHVESLQHKIIEMLTELSDGDPKLEIAKRLSKMNFDELESRVDVLCDKELTREVEIELEMIREVMLGVMEEGKRKGYNYKQVIRKGGRN